VAPAVPQRAKLRRMAQEQREAALGVGAWEGLRAKG